MDNGSTRGSVLVVDDEPTITDVVSRYLQRAGYSTRSAGDGPAALEAAGEQRPDLVVLDLMLPGMDGLEVMRRLREQGPLSVILLTAKGEPTDRVVGLRLGADDYVVKPFSPAELVARVDAVLRRVTKEPELEEPISFDDLVVDPVGRRVTVRGEEVQLTVREYDLLLHFVRHPSQVFSRDQLMDAVWQYSFYTDTSTVTVHVRRLRAKIELDPSNPRWLETVWGVGYQVPAMTVRAGLAALVLASVLGGVIVGLVYNAEDGLLTTAFLLGFGAPAIGGVHLLARNRSRSGSLSRQFATGIGLTVGLVTLGMVTVALLMFLSAHDALLMALLLVFAGGLTAYSTWVLARGALDDVQAVRDGLVSVGDGRRDVKIETGARDELSELAAAANRMTAQLAEREAERDAAEQARRNLIAAVSHDLRTPLTSLRLLSEAIEDELVDDATRRRYLEQMSIHLRSLSGLIEDLFELSRLEAGDIQWSQQQVKLDELVGETVEAMRAQADAKRVVVTAAVAGDIAPAQGNPEKLQRVLFNLIQNAIRHTPADGSVTVAAESNGTEVEVEVADTGQGVGHDDRERVFEPFFRGGADAARSAEGTGLGLTICRAIVEAHGGRIWLADSAQGTRVRFSLPRA